MKPFWIIILAVIATGIREVTGEVDERCQTEDCLCCANATDGTRVLDEICPTANDSLCAYGCLEGYWGPKCHSNCSNCWDNKCDGKNGWCKDGCNIGNFRGKMCDLCLDGFYGNTCDKLCPKHCRYGECDKKEGMCTHGCQTFYHFLESLFGFVVGNTYGVKCDQMCPNNCYEGLCFSLTGTCSHGCVGKFTGSTCDECIRGFYGNACDKKCPDTCVNNFCYKDGGKCGDCVAGYHGARCDLDCNPYCINGMCGQETGFCLYGCVESYAGQCRLDKVVAHDNVGTILGVVVGGLSFVIMILVGYFIYLRCRGRGTKDSTEPEPNNDAAGLELGEPNTYEGLVDGSRNERTIYSDLRPDEEYINI